MWDKTRGKPKPKRCRACTLRQRLEAIKVALAEGTLEIDARRLAEELLEKEPSIVLPCVDRPN